MYTVLVCTRYTRTYGILCMLEVSYDFLKFSFTLRIFWHLALNSFLIYTFASHLHRNPLTVLWNEGRITLVACIILTFAYLYI